MVCNTQIGVYIYWKSTLERVIMINYPMLLLSVTITISLYKD